MELLYSLTKTGVGRKLVAAAWNVTKVVCVLEKALRGKALMPIAHGFQRGNRRRGLYDTMKLFRRFAPHNEGKIGVGLVEGGLEPVGGILLNVVRMMPVAEGTGNSPVDHDSGGGRWSLAVSATTQKGTASLSGGGA